MKDPGSLLNGPQREAVNHKDGALLVIAGAGAGKTKVITHRIAELVKKGAAPAAICAVTFTNKAAQEMRERISGLLSSSGMQSTPYAIAGQPFIGTFHSLGVFILREHGSAIGVKKSFSILDRSDALAHIREAMKENGFDSKAVNPRQIQGVISRNKGELFDCEDFESTRGNDFFSDAVARVWTTYRARLARENALDFDDLLLKTVRLLQKHEDIRQNYGRRWNYLHIDEYQDTNHAQYTLSRLLAEAHGNVCAVGDADQTIYSWRGAKIRNILRFERDYPNARVIFLEENYRSTNTILSAANAVIKKNSERVDKTLFTRKEGGDPIRLRVSANETGEAFAIAREAKRLIQEGVPADEIAVLYRANFQSRALEEAFLAEGVSYSVLGTRFFERQEIKDVLSYIRAARTPESMNDYRRALQTPSRGIGKTTIAKLLAGRRAELPARTQSKLEAFDTLLARIRKTVATKPPAETVKFVLSVSGLDAKFAGEGEEGAERLENIRELAALASRYDSGSPEEDMARFLENAALAADQDALLRDKTGGVRLMTVHASKGLEFDVVFIAGLEQGLFPHESFGGGDAAADRAEEERRLFYVALTRAAQLVYLSYAEQRTVFGSRTTSVPSEFLSDIPEELLEIERTDDFLEELLPSIH